ncbi:hypothetical protein [Micropruina sp.]|uniref:hypothetical protein n=1 Tax=Micropruina sp. TaxID=2737536 RepID=UPI0039E3EA29
MLATRLGPQAAAGFHRDVLAGAYRLASWRLEDHALAVTLCEQFGSDSIGIADAANVVRAAAHNTNTLFTLDLRHFRALAPLTSETAFRLLPYDC